MAHREFIDSRQVIWDVWDVYPALGDRRESLADRRRFIRDTVERRTMIGAAGLRVSPEFTRGWLAFQSEHERRRLAPVPVGWEGLDEADLERLCQAARPVGRPRRLIE
jgi:predicted metal-dependent hydrolase